MDTVKLNLDLKNLRKAAFAVGVGLTVGKTVGDLISSGINGAVIGVSKICKADQEKTAGNMRKNDIEHEENVEDNPKQ